LIIDDVGERRCLIVVREVEGAPLSPPIKGGVFFTWYLGCEGIGPYRGAGQYISPAPGHLQKSKLAHTPLL
jgi:hypothetical protein